MNLKYIYWQFLYKIVFFNYYYYNIKLNTINILNLILNLKYLLYLKLNLHEFLEYIMKFLQNIKNKIIYFKSNYYYFKKQKLTRKRKRRIPLISLLSTNLKRNWFSLKSRSSNFFVFHNIYLLNIKNYYLNKNDINLYHFYLIMTNTLPFIKIKVFKNDMYLFFFFILYFLLLYLLLIKNILKYFLLIINIIY